MSATVPQLSDAAAPLFPQRFRSLRTLLALTVVGSLAASAWLVPSRLERIAVAVEQGDQPAIDQELRLAVHRPVDPGEARSLVGVALDSGEPAKAAAILEQFLTAQPGSVDGLQLLADVQRQRHLSLDVAALDERIFAITGDPDALRESADIYASRHLAEQRVGTLRRLAAIGHATAFDMAELTHRLSDTGRGNEALALLMAWLEAPLRTKLPVDLLGLAAGLSAATTDASAVATRLGALIARNGQVGPLHVLIQTYTERGRPALSLVAARALGDAMAARPDVALVLAQLEALQGDFTAARARLETLDRAGTLSAAGGSMLAELSIQAGDLARAVTIVAALPPEQLPEGLPHRFVEAIVAAGRTELLAHLPLEAFAAPSPASAAVVAFARGNRARASVMAQAALANAADPEDLGPAFGRVVHGLGIEHAAIARLLTLSQAGPLDADGLSLLFDLADTAPAESRAISEALRAQRDLNPQAGLAWALFAARHGLAPTVAAWLRSTASSLPAQTLLDLLLLSVDRNETGLTRAAASALSGRNDLPAGWTAGEIAFTVAAKEKLTPDRLRSALDLIGSAATDDTARNRVAALIVGAPGFAELAPTVAADAPHAVTWLASELPADRRADRTAVKLELLAAIAPQRALGQLTTRVAADPRRWLPIYVAALQRAGHASDAEAELRAALRTLPPRTWDAVLYETLARLPSTDELPLLRVAATTGRTDWISAYQEQLARLGRIEELRSVLRAEAASSHDPKRLRSLASRLLDLNDRPSALTILKTIARDAAPASPDVEQLMFTWGPRDEADAIVWTKSRALAAPLDALPKWLEHLAYLGEPAAAVAVVEQRPAVLSVSAGAVRTYGAALIASRTQAKPDLRGAVVAATKPDVLKALAQLALDTSQPAGAWQAARAAAAAAPHDQAALLLAAESAAAMRRSDDAALFYARLLSRGPQPVDVCVDAGDALLTAKRTAEGRDILRTALTRLPDTPATMAAARLRARLLMLLARDDEAATLLTSWLSRFPNDAGLRADLLQARLDRRSGSW